jgi:hypothetical protein
MALPYRKAGLLVTLSNPDGEFYGFEPRPNGTNLSGPIGSPPFSWVAPGQKQTYSYQHWFSNYPDDVIVKMHEGVVQSIMGIGLNAFANNIEVNSTYPNPVTTVYSYDPTPPPLGPGESPPDPNGTPKVDDFDRSTEGFSGLFYPRWHTDPTYELYNSEQRLGSICPLKDHEYTITGGGFFFNKPWSFDLTVTNKESEVLNEETNEYEYYPFDQATFEFKQVVKLKLGMSYETCCWNEGAVINGEVRFQSVTMTLDALPAPGSDYGFGGMTAKTGTTAGDEGSQSFSITVNSSYMPIEIVIPAVAGKVTFVNDFVITSVTKPT